MRAAARSCVLLALAMGACGEPPREAEADNAAATDVEALPADESAATPTDELANGAAEPVNSDNAGY